MNPNSLERVYKKSPQFISRKIADELVLIPLKRQLSEVNSIFSANYTALAAWDLVDGIRTVKQIKDAMLSEFDITDETLEQDLTQLFGQLEEIKAVICQ